MSNCLQDLHKKVTGVLPAHCQASRHGLLDSTLCTESKGEILSLLHTCDCWHIRYIWTLSSEPESMSEFVAHNLQSEACQFCCQNVMILSAIVNCQYFRRCRLTRGISCWNTRLLRAGGIGEDHRLSLLMWQKICNWGRSWGPMIHSARTSSLQRLP